ncbi:hypothetical protein Shyhy01_04810 [Streptomyces hygroscopicus subsp. hygroscopicus]|uniref:hypothetical protein n=1 Tax=Streptomyces sp. KHY 26 TaxID=3097359 RepID=UPI0024A3FD3C|nr:hypothetical protein [Streptomyces hygroscopicus]GLX47531.1 hypothetical protein Shyhy01_04810 [Streptomyces hygroscopicus subsp. hygroscopicus]
MRAIRVWGAALLVLGLAAGPAAADSSPSPGASDGTGSSAPTQAGTSFRTATEIQQGQQATASGSTGDYLYWSFPADTGQRPTVEASVTLPRTHGTQTWQLDVYDGLRRRQSCQYGSATRTADQGASSVELACVMRTVRGWAEPWANDPLPGTYYVRLTVVDLAAADLGQPVNAEVRVDSKDIGGPAAVDGSLGKPLVPGIAVGSAAQGDDSKTAVLSSFGSRDGWSSGWWSDRWVWTGIGAVLAALAGIGGYALTRGSGRPPGV